MKKYSTFCFFFAALLNIGFLISVYSAQNYLVTGSANPGKITLYKVGREGMKPIKIINTGYKFVHTVRIGDILNDGNKFIIAGVSNSFYAKPYGCKVIGFNIKDFRQKLIDDVGDLRCKDLTIGDADNDGKNEIILGTHGEGLIRLYKWQNGKWQKKDLEKNFIAKIDSKEKTNHRVPNDQLPCVKCVIQTAVHIVKIADIDNDGKNEIIATISSPLELLEGNEISFVKVYKKKGNEWKSQIIDKLVNREFRSIAVGDVYNKNSNTLIIGIGSPRNEKGFLYSYEYFKNRWIKTVIYNDAEEKKHERLSYRRH